MTIIRSNIILAMLLASAIALLALIALFKSPQPSYASVSQGSEYHATTTSTGRFPSDISLPALTTLGSVVITGTAAGTINLYDATTSSVLLRAASMSSSSILIASIPNSAAAGTYTFDEAVYNGLYVNITGTMPTSTITYR